MKRLNTFLYFLSAFIATASLLLFIFTPLKHSKPVWKDYRILAVPASADAAPYLSALKQTELSGVVSEFTVPHRFAFLDAGYRDSFPFTDTARYMQWFTDEHKQFRYFYIPYTSFSRFIKLYRALYGTGQPFYLEPAFSYAFFNAGLAAILFLCCLIGSRKKCVFATVAFSFLCYALCVKSSLSLISSLISIFSTAYWIEALDTGGTILWEQLRERIRRNIFMFILPAVSLASVIIDGLYPLLFYCLALALSGSAFFSVYSFLRLQTAYREQYRLHPSLKVLVMHPQSWFRFWDSRYALAATILTVLLLFCAGISPFLVSWNRLNHTAATLSIPSPLRSPTPFTDDGFFELKTEKHSGCLPDLGDYIEDCWYETVLPYLNVHEPLLPITKNAEIRFDFFTEDSKGKLHREERQLFMFNTDFIRSVLRYDKLSLLPLEKMLARQGGFTGAVYRQKRLFTAGKLAVLFIGLGTLLFPCILIIIVKTR